MSAALTPAALADRLEQLRPCWRDPSRFLGERSALARELRMLAVPRSPLAVRHEVADPRADERLRRLEALMRARAAELAALHRLLASHRPRPRRRRGADARQLDLLPPPGARP